MPHHPKKHRGYPLQAEPVTGRETTAELLSRTYLSYGGREIRHAYELLVRAIRENHIIFLTFSGALTPADLARGCINPLIERGIIDVICTTGANLYHDVHRSLGFVLEEGTPHVDDRTLREERIIRIYDIFFDEDVLLDTDRFFSEVMRQPEFQRSMTTAEFHDRLGQYVTELERQRREPVHPSLLATCFRHRVPIFCGAPQDGSIFLNAVKLKKEAPDTFRFQLDVMEDVFEFSAYQYWAKTQAPGKMTILILGGGVPKNYTLQGEPLLSQIFGIDTEGFDIDIQISDANVHTGGLSGCPASEGHTWGKTSADCVINSIFCHGDVTQIFPLLTHAVAQQDLRKEPRRLADRRADVLENLRAALRNRQ